MTPDLKTFDGLDNRKELLSLLGKLSTDDRRARFIASVLRLPRRELNGCLPTLQGTCDPVTAYFMLVSICNDLGVSMEEVAKKLEGVVRKYAWNNAGR